MAYTGKQLDTKLYDVYTKGDADSTFVSEANIQTRVETYSPPTDLSPYSTTTQMNSAISTAVGNVPISLGDGQTWQELSASRSLNTTYTNSTGRPIVVMAVRQSGSGNYQYIRGYIDGNQWHFNSAVSDSNTGYSKPISYMMIVPNGSTYQWQWDSNGGSTITFWELR